MAKKYLAISLEGQESKKLAGVLSSDKCKKILSMLAEKEASETDIARELKTPINTIEYNLKKLLETGLVKKSKNFFWSRKGKKIDMYKTANRSILISPKFSLVKLIVPAAIISIILAFLIKIYYSGIRILSVEKIKGAGERIFETATSGAREAAGTAPEAAGAMVNATQKTITTVQDPYTWLFFLIGALVALLIFFILNRKKF